jgi:hypothetical protein
MSFGQVSMSVNDEKVTINVDEQLEIHDLSLEMDQVAARMAYWGDVWAAAEAERERADAYYRKWRAELGQKILAANDKAAEWKVRQDIEADSAFYKLKDAIASATYNATMAKVIYESFRTKASILQSKGAMARAEIDSTGMTTKREAKSTSTESERAAKVDAMRTINAKKKTSK